MAFKMTRGTTVPTAKKGVDPKSAKGKAQGQAAKNQYNSDKTAINNGKLDPSGRPSTMQSLKYARDVERQNKQKKQVS